MIRAWRNWLKTLGRFRFGEDGVAAVEFALILPAMITLYIGSIEGSALISMDRRVQSITGSLGDLVARANTTLPVSELSDYFTVASGIMSPSPTDGLRQIVTQVEVKADGTTRIDWSKQFYNGTLSNASDYNAKYKLNISYVLPAEMIAISKGQYVIVAEASYSYLPVYGIVINQKINLSRSNFFMPRFGGKITLK